MTVSTTTSSVTVLGNGATTTFSYAFMIPGASSTDQTNVTLTLVSAGVASVIPNNSYSITGVGTGSGTFTYAPAIGVGSTLTLTRTLPATQSTSLTNVGAMYPAVVESMVDYVTMLVQQSARTSTASLQFPATDVNPVTVLPPASVRINGGAGSYLAFDGTLGNPTVVGGITTVSVTVSLAMQPIVAASTAASGFTMMAGSAATINGTLSGLTGLTVASGGASITGNSTITGTLSGLTGLTLSSGTLSLPSALSVPNGGTGAVTLTQNGIVQANGTSPLTVIAPGANGTVLTSNGTTASFQAPAAAAVSSFNGRTGAVSLAWTDVTALWPASGAVGSIQVMENHSGGDLNVGGAVAGGSLRFPAVASGGGAAAGTWVGLDYVPAPSGCSYSKGLFRRTA